MRRIGTAVLHGKDVSHGVIDVTLQVCAHRVAIARMS